MQPRKSDLAGAEGEFNKEPARFFGEAVKTGTAGPRGQRDRRVGKKALTVAIFQIIYLI